MRTPQIYKGKIVNYDAKKAKKAYEMREKGETFKTITEHFYPDKHHRSNETTIKNWIGYYKRDFLEAE